MPRFYDFFSKDGLLFDTLDTNKATQILIEVEGEKFQRDAKYTFNFTISEFQVQFTIILANRTKKCPIFSMAFMLGTLDRSVNSAFVSAFDTS